MFDVAIIGAGVIGGMIARELSRYQLSVCLLEKENDVAMGATKANSAIVHAGFDAHVGTLKAELNVKGSEMMEKIASDLGVKYERNQSLVVAFSAEDLKTLELLYRQGKENGVRDLFLLSGEEVRALEPSLSENIVGALLAKTGAIICPYELNIAAVGNAMDNGVTLLRHFEVVEIRKQQDGFLIFTQGDSVSARYVVNAAGIYSDAVASMVGDDSFRITPRRGEYIIMDKECGKTVTRTIFRTPSKMGKGILVTPTVDGNLMLGPTAENIEDKENKETTAAGISSVLKNAEEVLAAVPRGKNITTFCGLRSVGSTGDFIINKPVHGFVNAAGIESPGLSSSPAIAEYVVQLLSEDGLALQKKENFQSRRAPMHAFREMDTAEKNKVIAQNPRYGKIVCRCEGVTEGEIADAILTNPGARDIDGVKRRTRSGMGRCQGGFCSPSVVELIADELHIPFEKVTKFGKNSFVNFEKTKGGHA